MNSEILDEKAPSTAFKKQYQKWLVKQYLDINKPIVSDNAQIIQMCQNFNPKYSSIHRIRAIRTMAYDVQISTIDTICTVCRIVDVKNNESSIYGFIFSEPIKDQPVFQTDIVYNHVMHRFFSSGPSFLSRDGEYRAGFVNCGSLLMVKKQFSDIWDDIERYLSSRLTKSGLRLFYESFYPTDDHKNKYGEEMDYNMMSHRLHYDLYIIAWFKTARRIYYNSLETHTNEKYTHLIMKNASDNEFIKQLMERYEEDRIDAFREIISTYYPDLKYDPHFDVKMGQKIIPLNLSEIQNPFNIYYKPWKEYLVSQAISSLVVNNISPGFPITNRWIYIKNTKKGIFDNPIQYEKMERSDAAKEIANLLLQAQIYTYKDPNVGQSIRSIKRAKLGIRDQITTWLSNKFQVLHDKIQDPIDYSKEELIMGDAALCILSENVGRTFFDMMEMCKKSEYYNKYLGDPLQKGVEYLIKFLFDICYNLYCLNTKFGVIHADLHLNNATIHHAQPLYLKEIAALKKGQVLYVLGDSSDMQFLMPSRGYHANIIDFSRCIIHPEKLQLFKDPSLPKIYDITDDMIKFQSNQIEYLTSIYMHEFPQFASKKDELILAFKKYFDSCFRIFTTFDIYVFTKKIIAATHKKEGLKNASECHKINKKGMDLIQLLNTTSEQYLTTKLMRILDEPDFHKEIINQPWPMLSIIKQCFSTYTSENVDVGDVIDIFNYQNELLHSIDAYEHFPTYLQKYPQKGSNDAKKSNTIDPEFVKKEGETIKNLHVYEDICQKNIKMIEYIAKRHLEKYL